MEIKKPILVTGSHRSGTTWTGQMIAASKDIGYIHEPFDAGVKLGKVPLEWRYWFQYVCHENENEFKSAIDDVVGFRYPISYNLRKCNCTRDFGKVFYYQGSSWFNQFMNKRPLLKDPLAFFSAEWIYERYHCDVIVLIRHPAAFYSSLKMKNWSFDFNHFLGQPLLMDHVLAFFRPEIEAMVEEEKVLIEQSVLLWNCIHQIILEYQHRHKDWLFIKHEDLSLDPLHQFEAVYEYLNLDYTDHAQAVITAATGAHNPFEQTDKHEHLRDSKKNILNWKTRLTEEEIFTIKSGTSKIAEQFYNESDW